MYLSKHRVSFSFSESSVFNCGLVSAVGITIRYRLDCLEFEKQWKSNFQNLSRVVAKNTQRHIQWKPDLYPRAKRAGCGVNHPPHLVTMFKKFRATLLTLSGPSWHVLGWTLYFVSVFLLSWHIETAVLSSGFVSQTWWKLRYSGLLHSKHW
jgi:hypothetical protein